MLEAHMSLENIDNYSSLKEKDVIVYKRGITGVIEKAKNVPKNLAKAIYEIGSDSAKIEEFDYDKNHIQIRYNDGDKTEDFTIDDFKNAKVCFDNPDLENSVLLKIRKDELFKDSPLFNTEKLDEKTDKSIILEQWRVAVESAMNVSSRRQATNTLFFAILTVLVSGVLFSDGIFDTNREFRIIVTIIVSVLGMLICIEWLLQINYYGKLNAYKYSAIRKMEKYLPVLMFNTEDVFFYSEYRNKRSFSKKERRIPALFFIAFLGIVISTCIIENKNSNVDTSTNISAETNNNQNDNAFTNPTTGDTTETANEVEPSLNSQ